MGVMDENSEPKGRSNLAVGIIQLVFVIGVIGAAVGLSQALKIQVNSNAPALSDLRSESEISVRVAPLQALSYTPVIKVNGTVQSSAEVSVTPQVSGEIRNVSANFRSGATVEQGDLLFEIDRADFILAVQRADAEIASAKSDLKQLEAEAALAIQEWEELFPGRDVNDLAARVPQIEAAQARLISAEANKRTAELSLERTRVYAPVDARVMSSSLDIGQIVSPGQAIGRLVGLDSIEFVVPVSLDQLNLLSPALGRSARIERKGSMDDQLMANVVRVDASLDPRTRLTNLYLAPARQADLRIGDFVVATLETETVTNALRLPATALSGQSQVWVVEDGVLMPRAVAILGEDPSGASVIAAPFDVADGIVALPPLEAEPGQPVAIRQINAATASVGGGDVGSE
ncbi:MAG: efflux RND transporter periplasmic adaptor subunit [Pseudomonadota bacterium]